MTAHYRTGGVWKEITEMHTKVSGVWKEITEGHVKVSGSWKQFFSSSPTVFMQTNRTISSVGIIVKGYGSARASIEFETGGTLDSDSSLGPGSASPSFDDALEWCPNGTPTDWHVRCTATGDTADMDGDSLNTWLALGSVQREWGISVDGASPDSVSAGLTFAFSDDGGTTTVYTYATTTITASIS